MRKTVMMSGALFIAIIALTGCSSQKSAKLDPFAGVGSPYYTGTGEIPMGGGRRHLGKPYQVAGRWFTPKEQPAYDKTGPASWYGEAFHRRMTANGEWFDMADLTAAHPTLPLPSYAKVTNQSNGATLVVRINDRGPFVGPRIIDLSKASSVALGFKDRGTATVRVQYIGPAPLNDDGSHLMAMNEELNRGTPIQSMIAAAGNDHPPQYAVAAMPQLVQPVTYRHREPVSSPRRQYYVQIGTFSDVENAEQVSHDLMEIGDVYLAELTENAFPVYKLRMGPFDGQDEAGSILERVHQIGLTDAHLIETEQQQALLQ